MGCVQTTSANTCCVLHATGLAESEAHICTTSFQFGFSLDLQIGHLIVEMVNFILFGHSDYTSLTLLGTIPIYCCREMLQAKPWKCVCCGQPATKLFLHPMSYLHKPEPFVQDLGTSPGCSSQHCATEVTQGVRQIMAEVTDEAG